jgi:hypothetical protein
MNPYIAKPAALLLTWLLWLSPAAAQNKVTLEAREKWTNVFAETKVGFHFEVKTKDAFKGSVAWTLADAGTKRIFPQGRGETAIAASADKPALAKIPLVIPPLHPGVVLQAQLTVSVLADGKPEAVFEKTMWIFPTDPFVHRMKWLEELKIALFDPDPKSRTAEALKSLKVPFEEVRNPAALSELKEGLVLVGEGVSFKDEPALAEALVQAASRGLAVLCLAPSAGMLPLPGADNDLPAPGTFVLHRQDIIARLDKRLDAHAWAPDNQVLASSLVHRAEEGKVVGEMVGGAKGWPWLQVDYPGTKGRLVLCGFGIISRWESSPTPRFLFARLLEHMTDREKAQDGLEGTASRSGK